MAAYQDDVLFNKNTSQVGHFLVESCCLKVVFEVVVGGC